MEDHKKQSMITSHVHLAAQGGGGGGLNLLSEAEPVTECYRTYTVWVWTYYDGVFLCTLIFFFLAAQGGGG